MNRMESRFLDDSSGERNINYDFHIYLDVKPDVAIARTKKRGRLCEIMPYNQAIKYWKHIEANHYDLIDQLRSNGKQVMILNGLKSPEEIFLDLLDRLEQVTKENRKSNYRKFDEFVQELNANTGIKIGDATVKTKDASTSMDIDTSDLEESDSKKDEELAEREESTKKYSNPVIKTF